MLRHPVIRDIIKQLEMERDYYGLVMESEQLKKAVEKLEMIRYKNSHVKDSMSLEVQAEVFLEEFTLLDPQKFTIDEAKL
jgi:hypothetical protein